jgi:preprotein translocase subunit Sec63
MTKILLVIVLIGVVYLWWQGRASQTRRALPMPVDDARRLLGLTEGASLEDIRGAHRRLIARVHPDTGGSAELAERVNAARDALVAEMNRKTPRAS